MYCVVDVPFQLPQYPVKQHWHERYHNDTGTRWLRRSIAELMTQSAAPSTESDTLHRVDPSSDTQ